MHLCAPCPVIYVIRTLGIHIGHTAAVVLHDNIPRSDLAAAAASNFPLYFSAPSSICTTLQSDSSPRDEVRDGFRFISLIKTNEIA